MPFHDGVASVEDRIGWRVAAPGVVKTAGEPFGRAHHRLHMYGGEVGNPQRAAG